MRRALALGLGLVFMVGCEESQESGKVPLGASPAPQNVGALNAGAPASANLTGTVLEQIAAAPYVYVRLKAPNGEVWAAVNEAPVKVGQEITVYGALLMENFESKTLKRTFPQVYFGSLEPVQGAGGSPGAVGTPAAVDAKVGKVERASGADAKSIEELWAQQDALDGKSVTIRGVVVKYNPQVMGKNWIHLQDGSGDVAKNTHDITVTTLNDAAMGATITIRGTVRRNKDFGAGYSYALIIEDATVSK